MKNAIQPGHMFTKDLSSELRELLDTVTPNFQENLIRAFKNEVFRHQNRGLLPRYIHDLEPMLISVGNLRIELRNLKFPWIPDFRINNMSLNLKQLCMDVDYKLGDLKVDGEYESNDLSLLELLPVSNSGKIQFTFKDVTAKGRVGLLVEEDSIITNAYDIDYQASEKLTTVKYYTAGDNETECTTTKLNGELSLGDSVWSQLTNLIQENLYDVLGEVVVEYSLTETLMDEDHEFRQMAKEYETRANKFLDSLLCLSKDFIVGKNNRQVQTPGFTVTYRAKPSSPGGRMGIFTAQDGYIQDLSTLTRPGNLSLYEDKDQLVVYGTISLREFKNGYEKFSSELDEAKIQGSIKGTIYRNAIYIKLVVHKDGEECRTTLETVKVIKARDIDMDASGLGSLSWLIPQLERWVRGNLFSTGLQELERRIREAIEYSITNNDCIAFLID